MQATKLRQKYAVARVNDADAGLLDHLMYVVIAVDERDAITRARSRARDIDELPRSRVFACPLESDVGERLIKQEHKFVKTEGNEFAALTYAEFRAALLGYFDDREVQYRTRKAIARKKASTRTKPPTEPKPPKADEGDGAEGVRVEVKADPFTVKKTHRSRSQKSGLLGVLVKRLKGA